MNTKEQINIFIVEDDEVYAKTLRGFIVSRFLEANIKIFPVGETSLLKMSIHPDIVIMDYFLNSKFAEAMDGLEIIKHIRSQSPKTNIIVLSSQDKYDVVLKAIKEYNCFYVQKGPQDFTRVEQLIKSFIYHNKSTQGNA